jgi:hypothetical protein
VAAFLSCGVRHRIASAAAWWVTVASVARIADTISTDAVRASGGDITQASSGHHRYRVAT